MPLFLGTIFMLLSTGSTHIGIKMFMLCVDMEQNCRRMKIDELMIKQQLTQYFVFEEE
jgi:hypothetical protein